MYTGAANICKETCWSLLRIRLKGDYLSSESTGEHFILLKTFKLAGNPTGLQITTTIYVSLDQYVHITWQVGLYSAELYT